MTREEFLLDTIKWYSENTNRRCVNHNGGCFYSPDNEGIEKDSTGCAIGRYLTPELQKKFDEIHDSSISNDYLFLKLPSNLKDLGQIFLADVQRLHDTDMFWGINELTELGKNKVHEIIQEYNLNLQYD